MHNAASAILRRSLGKPDKEGTALRGDPFG